MGNMGTLELNLSDVSGKPPVEPNCTIEIQRLDDTTMLRADRLQFPPSHTFSLPAFPQAQNLHCVITPSLYRIVQSEFFTLTDGQSKSETATVLRDPEKWRPRFTAWSALSTRFDAIKTVL